MGGLCTSTKKVHKEEMTDQIVFPKVENKLVENQIISASGLEKDKTIQISKSNGEPNIKSFQNPQIIITNAEKKESIPKTKIENGKEDIKNHNELNINTKNNDKEVRASSNGDNKSELIFRASENSNVYNIFDENNIVEIVFENGEPKLSKHQSSKKNEEIGNFENDESIKYEIEDENQQRKDIYAYSESEGGEDNSIFTLEKEIFELRNILIEKDEVRNFYSNINLKKWEEFSIETKGIYFKIKEILEKLMKLHNINIIEVHDETTIQNEIEEIQLYPLNQEDLDYFVPIFIFEFSLYPISLIRNTLLKNIYISKSLSIKKNGQSKQQDGTYESKTENSVFYSCENRSFKEIKTTIHSTLFKYIIKSENSGDSQNIEWGSLNAPNFEYGIQNKFIYKGFVSEKSMSDIETDRAEVFSYMFNYPSTAFNSEDLILRKKIMNIVAFFESYDPRGVGGENFWIILRENRKGLEKPL